MISFILHLSYTVTFQGLACFLRIKTAQAKACANKTDPHSVNLPCRHPGSKSFVEFSSIDVQHVHFLPPCRFVDSISNSKAFVNRTATPFPVSFQTVFSRCICIFLDQLYLFRLFASHILFQAIGLIFCYTQKYSTLSTGFSTDVQQENSVEICRFHRFVTFLKLFSL